MSYNYNILNNKDFYKNVFLSKINQFYDGIENQISNNSVYKPDPKKILNTTKLKIHKKNIAQIYFTPLLYLIYSYIYIKFYKKQQIYQIVLDFKLNFNLYTYIFSHKNPIIKKVNVPNYF